MPAHVIFAAPFFMDATLRFVRGAAKLPGIDLTIVSQDPFEKLPADLRDSVAGHWRVDNALDAAQLADAARNLASRFGPVQRYFGVLEHMQVQLAVAREALGVEGVTAEQARNFRDKSRMKDVLQAAGVPCARHQLAGSADAARRFAGEVGFPLVVKPPAGAGSKGTYRLDSGDDLEAYLAAHPHSEEHPSLYEEFVQGDEHSFDSVMIDGKVVWHSISRYQPAPLVVLENPWIQWCVILPRDISGPEYDPIRRAAEDALHALGLDFGLSHMEWFRLGNQRIAISEVGARPPGEQLNAMLGYSHDISFFDAWPRLMVTGEFDVPERLYASGTAYLRGQGQGTVRAVHGLDEIQARYGDLVVEAKLPKPGRPANDSYEGEGNIIIRHPETEVVEKALADIISTVRVEIR